MRLVFAYVSYLLCKFFHDMTYTSNRFVDPRTSYVGLGTAIQSSSILLDIVVDDDDDTPSGNAPMGRFTTTLLVAIFIAVSSN